MKIHNFVIHIPQQFKNKKVFTIIRNPYDLYVSLYEFRTWVQITNPKDEWIKVNLPNYPDINFKNFILFCNEYLIKIYLQNLVKFEIKNLPGFFSTLFILMYFKNNLELLEKLSKNLIDIEDIEIPKSIEFLRYENLRNDLFHFLKENENEKHAKLSYVEDVRNHGQLRNSRNWRDYYDLTLQVQLFDQEKLLFKFFPNYAE